MAMARIKAIWRVFSHSFSVELSTALRSPVFHWLGWCMPILLSLLIGSSFSAGTLENLPVAVVDRDHSPLSRLLIRHLDAGPHSDIRIVKNGELEPALHDLRTAKVYGLLVIPPKFEADVLAGRQPSVVFYYNALFYGAGYYSTRDFPTLLSTINQHYSAIIAAAIGKPIPPLSSVSIAYGSLFNASGSYIYYQQFAATIHLLQLFVVTLTIYMLDRRRTLLQARPFAFTLMGKLAPYTLSFTLLLLIQLAGLIGLSDATVHGNPLWMLAVAFCYVMAAQSIGILIFTFTRNTITAFSLIGLFVSIAISFSGIAVPELSMPVPAQVIAGIEPLTHALNAMFDIFLRDVPASSLLAACGFLLLYPILTMLLVRNKLMARLHLTAGGAA